VGVIESWLSLPLILLFFNGNFRHHQNLFMLVSALMGLERMKAAYAHAIENGYRFYSYGDGSLLLP